MKYSRSACERSVYMKKIGLKRFFANKMNKNWCQNTTMLCIVK